MGTFREYSIATREWHKTLLDENDKKILRNMPVISKAHFGDKSFFLAHASPLGDISKYLNNAELEEEVKWLPHEYILLGHTHIQYKKLIHNSLVLNPGSVGLSRNSGKACYAVYENDDFILKSIDYDVQATINDLMKSPIPGNCKEGLRKVLLHE
jgi:predicted phosphodiesterase